MVQVLQRHARLYHLERRHSRHSRPPSCVQVHLSLRSTEGRTLPTIDTTAGPIEIRWDDGDMNIQIHAGQRRMVLTVRSRADDHLGVKLAREVYDLPVLDKGTLRTTVEIHIVWFLWRHSLTNWMPNETWTHGRVMPNDAIAMSTVRDFI